MRLIVFEANGKAVNVDEISGIQKLDQQIHFIMKNGNSITVYARDYAMEDILEAITDVQEYNPLEVERKE